MGGEALLIHPLIKGIVCDSEALGKSICRLITQVLMHYNEHLLVVSNMCNHMFLAGTGKLSYKREPCVPRTPIAGLLMRASSTFGKKRNGEETTQEVTLDPAAWMCEMA